MDHRLTHCGCYSIGSGIQNKIDKNKLIVKGPNYSVAAFQTQSQILDCLLQGKYMLEIDVIE